MQSKIVVIVGETASGKSALAHRLALRFDGEIICADSRTVYRGMDIGTAKPSTAEQAEVAHHIINVVNPDENFNVAQFKRLASDAIVDIVNRGKLPIIVGGTGLYIDALIYDYQFSKPVDQAQRTAIAGLTVPELQAELEARGIALPENSQNPRHLQRALETGGVMSERKPLRENTLLLGLTVERDTLRQRITDRVDVMVAAGLIEEVAKLFKLYGPGAEALRAPGYRAFYEYISGHIDLESAKAKFVQNDMALAKRQRTWFKRNKSIHWLNDPSEADDLVTTFINQTA